MIANDHIEPKGNIKYVAVARVAARTIVASVNVDKDKATIELFQRAVWEVLTSPNLPLLPQGGRAKIIGDVNALYLTIDADSRAYMVITTLSYPDRLAFQFLHDLVLAFKSAFGETSLRCAAGTLDLKLRPLVNDLVGKLDNPIEKDKISKIRHDVTNVTKIVNKSMHALLSNIDTAERIEKATEELKDSAAEFDTQTTKLKRREFWAKWRTTIMIIGGFVVVIAVITLAIVAL